MADTGTGLLADVSRRRVLQGIAWTTPALVLAVGVPQAAASTPGTTPPDPNLTPLNWAVVSGTTTSNGGSSTRSTGWLPISSTDTTHASTTWSWNTIGTTGFLSQDDSNSTSAQAVVVARYTFTAAANVTYVLTFPMQVQWGGSALASSSRQSMVVSAIAPSTASTVLYKATVAHHNAQDSTLQGQGYAVIEPSTSNTDVSTTFVAAESGTYTLEYRFTIDPKQTGSNKYCADIWFGQPALVIGA
jgi:hypothetical protein